MQSNRNSDNRKAGSLSWEPTVTKKNGPLYKAICEQLKSDIQSGAHRFTVGQADPPAAFRICPVSAKDEHDLVKGLKIIRKTISEFQ